MARSFAFSSSVAASVLRSACERVGLEADDGRLLRLGENAIFVLERQGVVVRIARDAERMERVKKELCMARWLHDVGIPAVEVAEEIDQPLLAEGRPVTFWRRIGSREPRPGHRDLALLLARVHGFSNSPCHLPDFAPLALVEPRIAAADGVSDKDRDFLLAHRKELDERFQELECALPVGPIHGDAWVGNLMRDGDQVRLLDFEASAVGPREWDLVPTAIATCRYGLPAETYQAFCETYGFDVTRWSDYGILRDIRELTMTTWLMQNIREDPAINNEFHVRLDSIRRKDLDRAWRVY